MCFLSFGIQKQLSRHKRYSSFVLDMCCYYTWSCRTCINDREFINIQTTSTCLIDWNAIFARTPAALMQICSEQTVCAVIVGNEILTCRYESPVPFVYCASQGTKVNDANILLGEVNIWANAQNLPAQNSSLFNYINHNITARIIFVN